MARRPNVVVFVDRTKEILREMYQPDFEMRKKLFARKDN